MNPFKASASQSHMDFKQPDIPEHADIPDYTEGVDFQDEADAQEPQQPQSSACLQLQGRFIVTALSSGLAIIDQQRAHERVIYERLTKTEGQVPPSQTLLFPVSCQFTVADAELFGELLPDLRGYGFEVEPAGQATFVVTATPSDLKESDLQPLFDQMLADYKGAAMQKFSNRSHSLCASLARQMAVKSGKVLSQEEMQQLVADLFACPMADTSPSGKKIITIVNPEDILK